MSDHTNRQDLIDAAVRDPLVDLAAVLEARRHSMSERFELALNWNSMLAELRAGLLAVTRGKPGER